MTTPKKSPVGRGAPPSKHKFGADKPGNRRGRPKGSKNVKTILRDIAQEKHTIWEGDRYVTLTTVDLLLHVVKIKAMNGDIQADKLIDRYLDRQTPPSDIGGCLVVPEPMSVVEFAKRLDKENSLATPPVPMFDLDDPSKT